MDSCKKKNMFFTYGLLMLSSYLQVCSSTDTILTNQSLSGFQTIVSSGGVFELGLFTTGGLCYLGIWYWQIEPRTIVWVANRAFPAPSVYTVHLHISDGNLMLHDDDYKNIFWSTRVDSTSGRGDVEAVLLDNGNLVLRDGPTVVLWQSFHHPSDTWLPGARIRWDKPETRSKILTSWNTLKDPSPGRFSLEFEPGNSLVMVWNGSKSYWSSGAWDHQLGIFKQVTAPNLSFEFDMNGFYSYITYSVSYQNPFRLVMDVSGQLTAYSWVDKNKAWDSNWSAPSHRCKAYGSCGSFGICNDNSSSSCECILNIPKRSSLERPDSGICVSKTCLTKCGQGSDKFLPLGNVELASDPEERTLATSCDSVCLAECGCRAYAYDGQKCLIWTGDIFNLQQLDANNSKGRTFYVRLTPDHISQGVLNEDKQRRLLPSGREKHRRATRKIVLAVVLPSLAAAAALFISLYCYLSSPQRSRRAQRGRKQSNDILAGGGITDVEDGGEEKMFHLSLLDIMAATNGFSEENKLGEGGFGPVYKGNLPNGIEVAVKRLSTKSSQGLIEFKNEVVLIIKLQHKNLVKLLGYCVEGDEKLLIYEYMSNKSLDALLFDPLKSKELDWEKRMKIVIGTTKGLQYLHEDSRLKIIHRDLKASNILLDDDMNPKISDFGTARIFGCKQIDDSTQRIVGTFGYMSPEYALSGMISEKSDIYSFGVLLLEIVSGKKAVRFVHNDETHSIIAYAWESWCETKGVSMIDEALGDSYSLKEVMRCVQVALLCVQDHPKDRPTISQIVYMLSNDHDLRVPIQPTFTNVFNCNQWWLTPPSDYVFSINEATQSTMEGR